MFKRLVSFIRTFFAAPASTDKPWLVDRDGRVYKPERRVVLKVRA